MNQVKRIPALVPVLILVFVTFVGILVWAYVETKKANPQMVPVGQLEHKSGAGTLACRRPSGGVFVDAGVPNGSSKTAAEVDALRLAISSRRRLEGGGRQECLPHFCGA